MFRLDYRVVCALPNTIGGKPDLSGQQVS